MSDTETRQKLAAIIATPTGSLAMTFLLSGMVESSPELLKGMSTHAAEAVRHGARRLRVGAMANGGRAIFDSEVAPVLDQICDIVGASEPPKR